MKIMKIQSKLCEPFVFSCIRCVAQQVKCKKYFVLIVFLACVVTLFWIAKFSFFRSQRLTRDFDNINHYESAAVNRFMTVYCLQDHGLGNNIFQVASAYGIARHTNRTLLLDQNCALLKYFDINSSIIFGFVQLASADILSGDWYMLFESKANIFDSSLNNHIAWNSNANIKLNGYLQSWKYFSNVMFEVKKLLRFHRTLRDSAYKYLYEVVTQVEQRAKYELFYHRTNEENITSRLPLVFVGVHVRRGDMLSASKQDYGYVTADEGYIVRSMQYFERKYRFVVFVVCSDDLNWSRQHVKPLSYRRSLVVYCPGVDAGEDLAILSSCNHTIVTVGTFGWWAGLLAGGTVIYYSNFPRSGSMLDHNFSTKRDDYYYPNWIPM